MNKSCWRAFVSENFYEMDFEADSIATELIEAAHTLHSAAVINFWAHRFSSWPHGREFPQQL
jgi:hypothetical protein